MEYLAFVKVLFHGEVKETSRYLANNVRLVKDRIVLERHMFVCHIHFLEDEYHKLGKDHIYSKEEEMVVEELRNRNFTYLVNEHPSVDGYKCLFSEEGFDRVELRQGFPPIVLVKRAKVYVHQDMKADDQLHKKWPGC
ncbi:hypothetical protein IGI04_039133 [Brassica rapa subsp. trilocularis]|uniref:Uncharacterized protein n=1 Tax=Brassica rapa subsp. trilocularis TaxID=1813537 RepID=A0ABQ7LM61_BRACM|nr:hypothetical protein IGI04_039133 [Brassica rapa subsp. trilocularis]